MSDEVLILYGSRARGDARAEADVDLMLVTEADRPEKPVEKNGISLHRYPRSWLLAQASGGDLFAYHVGHEGVPLQDADGVLADLRSSFRRRSSYLPDLRTGLLVARAMIETGWIADADLRRRFFWGVRTCAISATALEGRPVFAAHGLQTATGIDGLADMLERRGTVTFEECRSLLERVVGRFAAFDVPPLHDGLLRTFLTNQGGYAAECVEAAERRRWEDDATVVTYA